MIKSRLTTASASTLLPLAALSIAMLLSSACGWQLRGMENNSHSESATNNGEARADTARNEPTTDIEATAVTTPSPNQNAITSTPLNTRPAQQKLPQENSAAASEKGKPGTRLIMIERNHGLSVALNRVAWERNYTFNDNARTWLVIENEKLEKRPLTVTETGVAAQYQLILTLSFSLKRSNGEVVTPSQQIVSWRSYDFDAKLIIAKAQEEEALIVEMREELAQRMLSMLK